VHTLLFLACAVDSPPPPISGDSEVQDTEPLPGAYVNDADEPEPVLSLQEIGTGIENALREMLELDPVVFHDVYRELRSWEDENCPVYLDYDTSDYWYDTCVTDEGASFVGSASTYRYDPYVDENGYTWEQHGYISADFSIETPDGEVLEGTGYSHFYEGIYPDSNYHFHYTRAWGRFRWNGPGSSDTWLSSGRSFDFYLHATSYPTYPGIYLSHYGGVAGMDGPVNAYVAESFILYSEGLGSACEVEPSGTISVRDEDGNWYDVDFDGPAYWGGWAFAPECDGCGSVWFRGQYIGETCVDFSPMLSWGDRPW
jgi:hypothetical protein